MQEKLKRIFWDTFTGPHAGFATGTGTVRRYAPGFSPIAAFANREVPDFAALNDFCAVGEQLYFADLGCAVPPDWQVEVETSLLQMLWEAPMPEQDEAPEAVLLGPEHVAQVMALATATRPGPFGPRTIELGDYFGLFDGDQLIAMAGERCYTGPIREMSGVCTHPGYRGQGLATRLMRKLLRRQMLRQERTFLNVAIHNEGARRQYERMGFSYQTEIALCVASRR
jgi:ribosomal protein S18 acetylase RimI-like enzyme